MKVRDKWGPPEEDRALRLDGRAGVAYLGDEKHEQASSLSHERAALPPKGTWTGDRHEGTRQGNMGCERSSRWRPHGNHFHPKWSSVPPGHLGHHVTNKRGPPEEDRAL